MINAYSTSYLGVYEYLELNNGERINIARHNHCADIFANSSQLCMDEATMNVLEQLINERRNNIIEEREGNEDRR